jgi:hypothetical protein
MGDKVQDIYDKKIGTINRVQIIAGLETYFVNMGDHEVALYADEMKVVK